MKSILFAAPAVLLLAACVSMPTGPSVMVLPGSGKNFDQFRLDDMDCRQFASSQIGGANAQNAAEDSTVRSAALGTAIGAVAGAAIGGRDSAGVGAGMGLLTGTLAGTGAGQRSGYNLQQRYDIGYQQCMYAKGNSIPGRASVYPRGGMQNAPQPYSQTPPPPPPPPPSAPR
jgi:hypothetical protein